MKSCNSIFSLVVRRLALWLSIALMVVIASCSNPADTDPDGGKDVNPPAPQPFELKPAEDDILLNAIVNESPAPRRLTFREYSPYHRNGSDTNRIVLDTSGALPKLSLHLKLVPRAASPAEAQEYFIQQLAIDIDSLVITGSNRLQLRNNETRFSVVWRDPQQNPVRDHQVVNSINDNNVEIFGWKLTAEKEIRLQITATVNLQKVFMVGSEPKTAKRKVVVNGELHIPYR